MYQMNHKGIGSLILYKEKEKKKKYRKKWNIRITFGRANDLSIRTLIQIPETLQAETIT